MSQTDEDRLDTVTHRVVLRWGFPDGQEVVTHVDVPAGDDRDGSERRDRGAAFLTRTWIRNWSTSEVVAIRELHPRERWRRGSRGPDPLRSGGSEGAARGLLLGALGLLRGVLGSDAATEEALGLGSGQLVRWYTGEAPVQEEVGRVWALSAVVCLLGTFLEASSIPKWLCGTNAHLGDRTPIRVLRQGQIEAVLAAIQTERAGSHA